MLEFIIGRAGAGKSYRALKEIGEKLKKEPLGAPIFLLLPEHMTYKTERELLEITGKGFFRASVYGFRRFAHSVLLKVGGLNLPRISDVGRNLLLKNILRKNGDNLEFFSRSAKKRGFSGALSDAIAEIKSYRLTAEDLKTAGNEVNDETLSAKLRDLAFLTSEFQKSMEGRYNDNEDILTELIRRMPQADFLRGAEVYVDGFIFFNPNEKEILRGLMRYAKSVHVTLPMDSNLNAFENTRETGLFNRSLLTMRELKKIAEEEGLDIAVTKLFNNNRAKTPALSAIEKGLFSRGNFVDTDGSGITLAEAATKRVEAAAAVSDIIRLTREENYRYKDVGVLIRDEEYAPLVANELYKAKIPFYTDSKRSAAHHPLAELLRSSLEAVVSFSAESVFRTLRTGFFNIPQEAIDRLENYVAAFNIRGEKRFRAKEDWTYRKTPLDGDGSITEADKKLLEEINFIRREALKPLFELKDSLKEAKTVRDKTTALYEFLIRENVEERLLEWKRIAESEGRLEAAALNKKVWQDVMTLFDQMVEVSGDEKLGIKPYGELLEEGLLALQMSLIPPGIDEVTVSSFNQNSLFNAKAIYILGANDGVMPHHIKESGFFSDADRLKIKDTGKEIASGSKDGNLAESYLLYRAFNEPRENLWVSYALSNGEGKSLSPAPLMFRLKKLIPTAETLFFAVDSAITENDEQNLTKEEKLKIPHQRAALSGLVAALRKKREGGTIEAWWADVYNHLSQSDEIASIGKVAVSGLFKTGKTENLSEELTRDLFVKNGKIRGSVTRFESFRSCPFQHFARYGLRLREEETFDFHALDLGNLLHSALRAFGEKLKLEGKRWADVEDAEIEEILNQILEEIIPKRRGNILLSSAGYRHQKSRIEILAKRSIARLIALDKVSKFHPALYEKAFGGGRSNPLNYRLDKKTELEVVGQIDRIDFSGDGKYFLVIDYKTGDVAINLLEVYYGLKMQLLTYLLAAKNMMEQDKEKRIPAGMLYFFLRYPMLTESAPLSKEQAREKIEKKLKMPGWILADEEVIRLIDETLHFLKIRLTRNSEVYSSDRGNVKTKEEFAALLSYIDNLLKDTAESVLTGNIERAPYKLGDKEPCVFCPYKIFCGFDPKIEGFEYRELKKLPEDEIYEKIREAIGEDGVDE